MSQRKIAVIVGASKGIGAAIARSLADSGYAVVLTYSSDPAGAAAVADEVNGVSGQAVTIKVDVRKEEEINALFTEISKRFGRIDVLVNNAGVSGEAMLGELVGESLGDVIDINLKAPILCSARALPLFPAEGGAIINIGSAIAQQPLAGQTPYAASKGGIEAVTRVLAAELGAKNIRVNAVAPGPTDTALLPNDPGTHGFIASRTWLARVGTPEDIAKVVSFLASDASGWITGEVIAANGGFRM